MKRNKKFIPGNFEDKYNSSNPISRFLVSKFLTLFKEKLNRTNIKDNTTTKIIEIGTGEGELLKIIRKRFFKAKIYGCDIDKNEIKKAKKNCQGLRISLSVQNAERLKSYRNEQFDLVICCEVLEHLENPLLGLLEINRILKPSGYLLASVPREPLWRILNILRGKYWKSLGNTPGHLNHWNRKSFLKFIKKGGFDIIDNTSPFPWTMVLSQKSNNIKSQKS